MYKYSSEDWGRKTGGEGKWTETIIVQEHVYYVIKIQKSRLLMFLKCHAKKT